MSLEWQLRADARSACDALPHQHVHLHRRFRSRNRPGRRSLSVYVPPGCSHVDERRVAGYTQRGEAEQYGLLIRQELMPWDAKHDRVRSGRAAQEIGGASLGVRVSLYLALRYFGAFGRGMLLSPSVWWNENSILQYSDQCATPGVERAQLARRGATGRERAVHEAELLARCLGKTDGGRASRRTLSG